MATDPTHIRKALQKILHENTEYGHELLGKLVEKLLVGMCIPKEVIRGAKIDYEKSEVEGRERLLRVIAALGE